jgi:hypothetical protein
MELKTPKWWYKIYTSDIKIPLTYGCDLWQEALFITEIKLPPASDNTSTINLSGSLIKEVSLYRWGFIRLQNCKNLNKICFKTPNLVWTLDIRDTAISEFQKLPNLKFLACDIKDYMKPYFGKTRLHLNN